MIARAIAHATFMKWCGWEMEFTVRLVNYAYCKLQNTVASFLNRYSIILSSFIESYLIEFHQSFWGFPLFQPLLLPTINRKVLTIPEGYLTREVQFDMGLQVQDKKYHHKVRLQSSFDSKSKQDSCVRPVTRGSIWHLGLKVQDMKYHHKVRLQSSFQSKSKQDSCLRPVTRCSMSFYCLLRWVCFNKYQNTICLNVSA